MKIGIFSQPIHPTSRPLVDCYEADQARVVLADELGFSEAFIGEHHTCAAEPVTSPLMLLAGVIEKTKNIKLGPGVICVPMHHPIQVASMAAQFDHMTRGRFVMGVGPGGLGSDIESMGMPDSDGRNEMLVEGVDIVHELWRNEPPYRIKTKHWDFALEESVNEAHSIGHLIKPLQQPHPPVVSTAMSPFSNSVKVAIHKGWGPMSANFSALSTVYSHWTKIVEAYDELGQEPSGASWRVGRNVVIADTDEEARDRMLDPSGPNYFYFNYNWSLFAEVGYGMLLNDTGRPDGEVSLEEIIENCVIYGSPDTVAQKLTAIREKAPFGTLLFASLDASSEKYEQQERETMRRLATEVLPKLKK